MLQAGNMYLMMPHSIGERVLFESICSSFLSPDSRASAFTAQDFSKIISYYKGRKPNISALLARVIPKTEQGFFLSLWRLHATPVGACGLRFIHEELHYVVLS